RTRAPGPQGGVEHQIALPDIPAHAGSGSVSRHRRDVVSGKWALAEDRPRIGGTGAQQQAVIDPQRGGRLDAVAPRRIEIVFEEVDGIEMNLVNEIHQVDAGLVLETAGLDAEAAFDVMRGLGLEFESPGDRSEERVECRSRGHALIGVGGAECACRAAEQREYVVDAMLDTGVKRIL